MKKQLLSTPRFTVEQWEQDTETGSLTRFVVVHPGAAVILPLTSDGGIVLIQQYRHATGEVLWELPAGTLEPDEEPIKTAHRELIEETGYRAGKLLPFVTFYATPGICTERMHAFMATDLTPGKPCREEGEDISVAVKGVDEVRQIMLGGEIKDGKTLAILGFYFLKREMIKKS